MQKVQLAIYKFYLFLFKKEEKETYEDFFPFFFFS